MGRRILYIDCVGGIAGDMLMAALADAADQTAPVDALPAALGFDDLEITWSEALPGGFRGRRVHVGFDPSIHPRHRNLADVEGLVRRAGTGALSEARALRVFRRLAEAEAEVHGASAAEVHFHEVGAVDAVADVLGCCLLLEHLGVDEIVCSSLPMGHGTIDSQHGTLPLPAPAVAAMLPGVPVHDAGVEGETVTPTGAALVTALADRFGAMPAMRVERVGTGAGSRSSPGLPNLVRTFVGRAEEAQAARSESDNVMVECTLDDMDPRLLPTVIADLLAAGAVDAYLTPVVMKKGRPGQLLSALAPGARREAVVATLLRSTTTLGCRSYPVTKHHLERRMERVRTPWGEVPVKTALLGGVVLRRVPEFDSCAELARAAGVPVQEVLAAATAAAHGEPSSG